MRFNDVCAYVAPPVICVNPKLCGDDERYCVCQDQGFENYVENFMEAEMDMSSKAFYNEQLVSDACCRVLIFYGELTTTWIDFD